MAAANIVARFEAKLDAQNAKLDAILDAQNAKLDAILDAQNAKLDAMHEAQDTKLDAQNAKIDGLRWVIGVGLTLLGVMLALFRFLD